MRRFAGARRLGLAALAAVSSCAQPSTRAAVAPAAGGLPQVAVNVVDAAGRATPGAVVATYHGPMAVPAAMAVTDARGVARIGVPEGTFALSVTSAVGAAWLPDQKAVPVSVRVDRPCAQVTGKVVVEPAAAIGAAAVHVTVLTDEFATFAANVDAAGRFASCVPAGEAIATVDGDVVAVPQRVRVARGAVLGVAGYWRRDVEQTVAAALDPGDEAAVVRGIPARVRVVGIGEANHGTAEFFTLRQRLALAMSATGPTIIMLEAGVAEAFALDRYAQGEAVDLVGAIRDLGYWMWNTVEFRAFMDAVRAHNQAHPAAVIRVLGFDVQDTQAACDVLLATATLSTAERALVERLRPDRGRAAVGFTVDDAATLDVLLARLQVIAPGDGVDAAASRVALAAMELAGRVGTLRSDTAEGARRRDQGMAGVVAAVATLEPRARIVALAHNAHLAREPYSTVESMGQDLARVLGDAYYPIGLFVDGGDAWAWNPAGTRREAVPLAATPRYALESTVLRATAGRPLYLHLRDAPAAVRAWAARPRYVREFGSQASGDVGDFVLRVLPTAFDAVIVIPVGHATTPLPAPEGG